MDASSTEKADELVRALVSTRLRRQERRAEIDRLHHAVPAAHLREAAARHGLLGLVVQRAGLTDLDTTAGTRAEVLRMLAIEHTTDRVLGVLADAGVPALALKGPTFSRRVYGSPGLRSSSDVDVLVGRDELPSAVGLVRSLGWGAPRDGEWRHGLPRLHQALPPPAHHLPLVELHWRVHWYEERFSGEVLDGATAVTGRLVPEPHAELMMLLAMYGRDGFGGLRLAADVAGWWDRYAADVTAAGLAALVHRHPGLEATVVAAMTVTRRLVGAPEWELPVAKRARWRARLAAGAGDWRLRQSIDRSMDRVMLVDALLTPPGGHADLVRRHVAPSHRRSSRTGVGAGARVAPAMIATARLMARAARLIGSWIRTRSSHRRR